MAPLFLKENFYFLVLFTAFFLFQLILRFTQLDFHGIWRDEVATLYFSGHLNEVLAGDSHTIFYYLLMNPIGFLSDYGLYEMRLFQGVLSFLLYLVILIRSKKLLNNKEWFIFNALYGLHPLVFGFARLARPYTLMIDLATLLLIESRLNRSKVLAGVYAFFLMSMHPLGVLPVLFELFIHRFDKAYVKTFVLAFLPVGLYYVIKSFMDQNALSYIGWIQSNSLQFFFELNGILMGSFFPDYLADRPEIISIVAIFMVLGPLFLAIFQKNAVALKEGQRFLFLYLLVFLGMSVLSLVIDLRIQRYYVFLLPYFLLMLSLTLGFGPRMPLKSLAILGTLLILNVAYIRPYFTPQASTGRFINELQHYSKVHKAPIYACGYVFHNWYFKRMGFRVCSNPEDVNFALKTSPLVYGLLDKRLSILPQLLNNNDIELLGGSFDNKILLVTPKATHESSNPK